MNSQAQSGADVSYKPLCSEVQSECHCVKRVGLPSLLRLQGQPAPLPSLEAPWTPWLQGWEVQTSVFVISPPTPDAPASSQEETYEGSVQESSPQLKFL